MDRVAISFGFIKIYWYSIFIFLGVIFGSLFIYLEAKKQHFNVDQLVDLVFYTVIVSIIGARAYYVLLDKSLEDGEISLMVRHMALLYPEQL